MMCVSDELELKWNFFTQVLAATGKSLIMLSIGMLIGFPTVLIPVLTSKDYKGDLHFNRDQASWYGTVSHSTFHFAFYLINLSAQNATRLLTLIMYVPQNSVYSGFDAMFLSPILMEKLPFEERTVRIGAYSAVRQHASCSSTWGPRRTTWCVLPYSQ